MADLLPLEEFNREGIYRALATSSLPETPSFLKSLRPRFDLHVFDQVESTNKVLWQMPNARAGTVAIAHSQTAGKGQRGKQWLSQPGGVYLSLSLEPDWPAEQAGILTLASAWGIASQFRHLGVPAQIKWPNDLVVTGRKLGGILSESTLEKGIITQAVIGVGINVCNPVPTTGITWQKLKNFSHINSDSKTSATTLCQVTAAVLLGIWRGVFYKTHIDSQTFTDVYQSLLTHLNMPVVLDGKTWKIAGITDLGHLILSSTSHNLVLTDQPVEQLVYIKSGELSLGYS
ncbi:MAG: biotin--[acetyl-CoA-carboxylase] ligase [Cyanobacteria bacterium P01_D01_bin.156]